MENKMVNWVIWDIVEPLAYKFDEIEDLMWADEVIDWEKTLSELQNQWAKRKTAYYCTAFALSMAVDCMEWEVSRKFLKGEPFGDIAVTKWKLDPKVWAYFSDMLKLAVSEELITSYWLVKKNVEELKKALQVSPIYTGSKSINFKETYKTGFAVRGEWYGHCFDILRYEKGKGFFSQNSYTDKEKFWIQEEDIDLLFNGIYNISIDKSFGKISHIESIIVSQKKERVPVPSKWKHLVEWDTIGVNMLTYYQMQEKFHLGEITEKDFRIFQIAYRRAYKVANYKQIKI